MAQKENIFPIDTLGGRIQCKRHELGLSRVDFYNRVMGNENISDASKERNIRNWESSSKRVSPDIVQKICVACGCSADYLFCLDDCQTRENQFISDTTGLSENSIEHLKNCLRRASDRDDYAQEYERKCIDSFNQVFTRIALMSFCKDLLALAQEKADITPSQKYWDEFNIAIAKGKKPKKTPQNILPYLKYDAERQQQLVKKFQLQEHLSDMINLLSESLLEFPLE